jgi:hypothetical protein
MFIKQSRMQNGRIRLSLVYGYKTNGVVKHKYIEHFGYLDDLQKDFEDPLAHFREIARQRTLDSKEEPITINVNSPLPLDMFRRNLGYVFL